MPRQPFKINPQRPYNLTGRCRNQDWFEIPIQDVWTVMEDHLFFLSRAFEISIHTFVLMDNHFHLMATSPEGNLSQAMQFFMGSTSRAIQKLCGRKNQIWGSRFYRSELPTYSSFLNCYKYVYRNPVDAGLSESVEAYPFSTLPGILGLRPLPFTITYDPLIFESLFNTTLDWLNCAPHQRDLVSVKKALARPVYRLPKINKRKNPLEDGIM